MKSRIFFLLMGIAFLGSCVEKNASVDSPEATTKQPTVLNNEAKTAESSNASSSIVTGGQKTGNTDNSTIDSDIQFIKDKFNIISQATDYRVVPFEISCNERSSSKLERKYNEKNELSYLEFVSCGGHGCHTRQHYYWDGKLIFIFHTNDFTPGSAHIIEENRTYFKNGEMIRCLEKRATYYEGQSPMTELLKLAKNEKVTCTPEKLTANLSEIETLSLDEAKQYFCDTYN